MCLSFCLCASLLCLCFFVCLCFVCLCFVCFAYASLMLRLCFFVCFAYASSFASLMLLRFVCFAYAASLAFVCFAYASSLRLLRLCFFASFALLMLLRFVCFAYASFACPAAYVLLRLSCPKNIKKKKRENRIRKIIYLIFLNIKNAIFYKNTYLESGIRKNARIN
jgi:hypothetical protein